MTPDILNLANYVILLALVVWLVGRFTKGTWF